MDVPLARARFQASSADRGSANGPGNEAALYRGPYTGLHLGPQSDLILHYFFFYFITDWLAVGHIQKKCPYFLTNLRQNVGDNLRYCHKIISS